MRRATLVVLLFAAPALTAAQSTEVPRTPWGHPELQGIWDQTTGTPLERSRNLADREFLTEEEAVAREARPLSPGTRVAKGPTPLSGALPMRKQIAEASEGAHEVGDVLTRLESLRS